MISPAAHATSPDLKSTEDLRQIRHLYLKTAAVPRSTLHTPSTGANDVILALLFSPDCLLYKVN